MILQVVKNSSSELFDEHMLQHYLTDDVKRHFGLNIVYENLFVNSLLSTLTMYHQ